MKRLLLGKISVLPLSFLPSSISSCSCYITTTRTVFFAITLFIDHTDHTIITTTLSVIFMVE
jgi:hypothetical protein